VFLSGLYTCMYNMYLYAYACLCIILSLSSCSAACLGGVMTAHVYSCAYVCVCICVFVYIYVLFFAICVACTCGQVFWAPLHVQVYTYTDVFSITTYTSATYSLQGCTYMPQLNCFRNFVSEIWPAAQFFSSKILRQFVSDSQFPCRK